MKPFNSEKAQFYYDTAIRFQNALVKSSNQLLEYEDKIRTLKNENAELKKQVDSLVANLAAAHEDRNEEAKSVFLAKQVEIPELLRENAALKKQANDEFDTVITRNMELERENAALQADKERLDWLESKAFEHRNHQTGDSLGFEWTITSEPECDNNIRSAIDAARKEAQP